MRMKMLIYILDICRIVAPAESMMEVDNERGVVLDRVKSHAFDVHSRNEYVAPGEATALCLGIGM